MKINREKLEYDVENILYEAHFGGGRRKVAKRIVRHIMDQVDGEESVNKSWNLAHDFAPELEQVARRLEVGLAQNLFKRTPAAAEVYKWILEQEEEGNELDKFIKWAMSEERIRYVGKYRARPENIIADYPQAFIDPLMDRPEFKPFVAEEKEYIPSPRES